MRGVHIAVVAGEEDQRLLFLTGLVERGQEAADVALFLKEMPRFERNYPGSGRDLLLGLRVRYLVVSFPTISTHGGRSLVNRYRQFFAELMADVRWPVTELMFEGEMVFIA